MSVNVIETVDAEINMDFKLSLLRPVRYISNYQDEFDLLWVLSEDLISAGLANFDRSSLEGASKISCLTKGIQRMYKTMLKNHKYCKILKNFNLDLMKVDCKKLSRCLEIYGVFHQNVFKLDSMYVSVVLFYNHV